MREHHYVLATGLNIIEVCVLVDANSRTATVHIYYRPDITRRSRPALADVRKIVRAVLDLAKRGYGGLYSSKLVPCSKASNLLLCKDSDVNNYLYEIVKKLLF